MTFATPPLLRNVRPWGDAPVDLTLEDGVITGIRPADAGVAPSNNVGGGSRARTCASSNVNAMVSLMPFAPPTIDDVITNGPRLCVGSATLAWL